MGRAAGSLRHGGWIALIVVAFATGAWADPCTTSDSCTEFVTVGGGPPRALVYRTYPLTTRNQTITDALVVIQGAERDPAAEFETAIAAARQAGRLDQTLIVAPRFAANIGRACTDTLAPNELNWNCDVQLQDWRGGGAAVSANSIASFDVVDALLLGLDSKLLFPNLKAVVVAGHSAGGQFVTNYQMANRVHEQLSAKVVYVAANASAYAYPDRERPVAFSVSACPAYADWPFGFSSRYGYAARLSEVELTRQTTGRPAIYLVGARDVQPIGGYYGSCAGMAQGATRMERGLRFAKHMSEGYAAQHTTIVVPGCGHSSRCMFTSEAARSVLFPSQ